ncbi:F-box domain-containing protein [Mycena chlorophos]|uniref:F-box domain-containing protein n=1 Tax=Mycena chlorophos TaxID=658473 RepID=A0A8H6SBG5_MYCCL|nr:F-box domain-containing protein [Mycena chlorophos]
MNSLESSLPGRKLWRKLRDLVLRRKPRPPQNSPQSTFLPSISSNSHCYVPVASMNSRRSHRRRVGRSISFEKPPKPPVDPAHNPSRPINRLPPEILAQIFYVVSELCVGTDITWVQSCSHVCAAWRDIALASPALWGKIIFRDKAWVDRCLERSKSSPVRIDDVRIGAMLNTDNEEFRSRIVSIDLAFTCSKTYNASLVQNLCGVFPALERLTMYDSMDTWRMWGLAASDSYAEFVFPEGCQPYPKLRELTLGSESHMLRSLPALPDLRSLRLEAVSSSEPTCSWRILARAMNPMQNLRELVIGMLLPSLEYTSTIVLPNLRRLELTTDEPQTAVDFLSALTLPKLHSLDINLDKTANAKGLLQTVFLLVGGPRSMRLQTITGSSTTAKGVLPAHSPAPGYCQHARMSFSTRDLGAVWGTSAYHYDVALSWDDHSLSDLEMSALFSALAEVPEIKDVSWLVLGNVYTQAESFWCDFAARIPNLRLLAIVGAPPAGLLWALVHDLQDAGAEPLLPMLDSLCLNDINLSTGGWLGPIVGQPSTTISFFERDNARIVEVVICYLEARKLRGLRDLRMELIKCCYYTVPEVKLLRMLVGDLFWDGWGSSSPMYGSHWDEMGGATIVHDLLSGQKDYEELDLARDEGFRDLERRQIEFWRRGWNGEKSQHNHRSA